MIVQFTEFFSRELALPTTTTTTTTSEQDITMEELERAIDESKRNKASGEDNIPYEFLNNLGSKAKELLYFYITSAGKETEYQQSGRLPSSSHC